MKKLLVLVIAATDLLAGVSMVAAQPADSSRPIRISMAKTFVNDQPQVFIDIATAEFNAVMKNTTGFAGNLIVKQSPAEIGEKLSGGQLDFAILYAHEFAWAQKKHPELRPLLIAATKNKEKRVHLIVHQNCVARSIDDLRGKKLDMPAGTKEYCRLYLDKVCPRQMEFFTSITKSASHFAALDAVARGDVDVAVIGTIWLDFYKEIKGPIFAKNLKILQQSEIVPPAVIVYRPGTLDDKVVEKVRTGLRNVQTDERGRNLLTLWHIEGFEPVPKDYSQALTGVLKTYPAPVSPR